LFTFTTGFFFVENIDSFTRLDFGGVDLAVGGGGTDFVGERRVGRQQPGSSPTSTSRCWCLVS